jgi:dipeptidyl aminopeptidase/acylaminoacyl peptidase
MKRFIAFLSFAGTLLAFDLQAAEAPTPVEDFFRLPQYASMRISPDGKHIAALAPVNGRQNLVVLDVPPKAARALSAFEGKDVVWFEWLNDKRLLLRTGSIATRDSESRGGGIFAVDADGGESRLLVEGSDERLTGGMRAVYRGMGIVRTIPDTDDFIGQEYVSDSFKTSAGELFRIDSRTGRRTSIGVGKPEAADQERWVVDRRGVARVLVALDKTMTRIWYRASAESPWQKLDDAPTLEMRWTPLAVAEDDATLYVSSRVGRDKAAIVRYDPAKRAFGEVVAQHPQVDLEQLVMDHGNAVGVVYDADRIGTAMFYPGLARLQSTVDAAFPGAVNVMSWSHDRSLVLVSSFSDVSPGSFYLLEAKKGRMEFLADRAPWIKAKDMSPMKPVRYAARDGLEIPAYLTVPRKSAGKALPLIVDVHGGPWVDGNTWIFDPEVQFFASRGYAVLQPNFRGTDRYGWKHLHASYGQWGLAMQDDITDGVKWAVEQGIADPKRVCIYGASYGGYAVMMGLAKTPELYRCGVDYVGVTDIPLMLTMTWSDTSRSEISIEHMKMMIGDPGRDAKRLAETSPVNLATRIKAPVLMAYGAADVRVPIEHGTRMKSALEKAGVKYQWMAMEGEGHGFRDPANQKAFYEAVEKFFAENLGPN